MGKDRRSGKMIPRSAHNMLGLAAMLALAVAAVAQQSPTSPVQVPDLSTGVQGVIMQPTPPSFGGGDTGGFVAPPPQTPQVAPPLQPNAVQTIRSTARRLVNVAGQQAFEPILEHEVLTGELPNIGQPVSVEALTVPKPVMEVLDAVAIASGWNIIASKGIAEELVRFSMKNVTPKQMMEALRFQGIYYDYDPAANLLYVMLDGEFLEREYGAPEHAEFKIEHADVLDMETILSALMSQTGKLISDPRTGLILVWDTQSNLDAMTAAVKQLDVPLEPEVFTLDHLSAEDLLDTIESLLSERGLAQADPRTNSIVVTDLPARKQQIGLMLEALDQKLETRTWTLNYADPEILVERLEYILPEELGTITVDEKTYQVSVTAIPSRIDEIDEIIRAWDVKGRQVQIEAYLVSASTTVMRDLSINWAYFDEISGVPFAIQSGNVQPDYTGGPEGGQRATAGRRPYRGYLRNPITGSRVEELSNTGGREAGVATGNYILDPEFKGNRVAVVLDYLDSTGEVSILSRSGLTVQDGEEAIFENTTDRPFQSIGFSNFGGVIDSSSPQQSISSRVIPGSVQFVTVGTILRVLPRISADDNILMDIEAEDSTAEDKTVISADLASTIPQKTQNKAETQVLVNDGQTIVIAGLRSLSLQDDLEKVPLLGDLPFIGRFFRTTSKDHTDRELAVFITPTIVDENTQPEAKRLAKFEEEASDTIRHSQKNIWGRTADRLAQGKNERSISVGQSGAIHSEGELVTVDDLNREFESLRSAKVKPTIILRVHPSSPVSVSASIQAAAEAAGLEVQLDTSRQPYVPNFDISVPPLVPSGEALTRTGGATPSAERAIQMESAIVPQPAEVEPENASKAQSTPTVDEPPEPSPEPAVIPQRFEGMTVHDAVPSPAPAVTTEADTPTAPPESVEPVVLSAPSPLPVSPRMPAPPAHTELPSPEQMGVPEGDAAFTIQVSSFAANNAKVAQTYEAEIERKTGYELRLVPSGDGKHIRAYVGGFPDRGSANLARQSLSKSPFFADCFVKALNEE
jgi:type II secretory pathway component GspD/PulD (secretin)